MLPILLTLSLTAGGACQPESVLQRYLERFNAHDADGVAALVAEDLGWFSVAGARTRQELSGREALAEWLAGYFAATPAVRAEFETLVTDGCLAQVRERVSWRRDEKEVSRTALATYQVRDGLIRWVWYFLDAD